MWRTVRAYQCPPPGAAAPRCQPTAWFVGVEVVGKAQLTQALDGGALLTKRRGRARAASADTSPRASGSPPPPGGWSACTPLGFRREQIEQRGWPGPI